MRRLIKGVLLPLAALTLPSCSPSELVLRSQLAGNHIVITFYKRGFFGGEYRIRPCVRQAILDAPDRSMIWSISAPPIAPTWRPCRELDALRVAEAPTGFTVGLPFDVSNAHGSAILTVDSVEGMGEIALDLQGLR